MIHSIKRKRRKVLLYHSRELGKVNNGAEFAIRILTSFINYHFYDEEIDLCTIGGRQLFDKVRLSEYSEGDLIDKIRFVNYDYSVIKKGKIKNFLRTVDCCFLLVRDKTYDPVVRFITESAVERSRDVIFKPFVLN